MIHRTRNEGGAVLIIFAISAVMLFAFVALAVDSAHAFVERRDSQAGADIAAIGAGLTLINNPGSDYAKAVDLVAEVYDLSERNVGPGLDWAGCTDPDRPSEFNVVASSVINSADPGYTDCVSWSSDWSKIRVRMPTRDIETFFGSVIGIDTIEVAAFAEVGAVVSGNGGVLPFGVLTGGTDGLVCLKTGPQFPSECDPNVSGNFGFLDFRLFGNVAMGTSAQCTGGSVSTLKENIAHGVDHDLTAAPSTPIDSQGIDDDATIIEDNEQCPGSGVKVQAVLTETGNKTKVIIDGFVEGINGFPGRLTLGSPTFAYSGVLIDDHGLWEYLSAAGVSACPDTDTEAEILACIASHPGVELFGKTIQNSPRLAVVPELWQTTWPSGSKLVSFQSFRFVYLQTLYGGCKNTGVCKLELEPGASGTKKVTGDDPVVITAISVPSVSIPAEVRDSFGTPQVLTYALTR